MHILFQFPIADLRMLSNYAGSKLAKPTWPQPDLSCFVNQFGQVNERKSGGSTQLDAEDRYCPINLIRYEGLNQLGFQIDAETKSAIYNSSKRFYSDGRYMNKVELGFVDNLESTLRRQETRHPLQLVSVIKHYASLPIVLNDGKIHLHRAGKALAQHYLRATTGKEYLAKDLKQFVLAGELVAVLVFQKDEHFQMPKHAKQMDTLQIDGQAISLYGYKLSHEGMYIKVWFIEIPRAAQHSKNFKDGLRNLRINLMRIHAEKETIRMLLNAIKGGAIELISGSKAARQIDTYLKKVQERLFRKARYGFDQAHILQFALQSEDVAEPGDFSSMESDIYYFRDEYLRANVEKALEGMAKSPAKVILFVSSGSGKDSNPLDFGKEFKRIQDAVEASDNGAYFSLQLATAADKDELIQILSKYKPTYIHFTMHGSSKQGLYFEKEDGNAVMLEPEEFADKLKLITKKYDWKPHVIFLNACHSGMFLPSISPYCAYSITMKTVIDQNAGLVYTKRFYKTLVDENDEDISYCHDLATHDIKYHTPPFDEIKINDVPIAAHEIPELNPY